MTEFKKGLKKVNIDGEEVLVVPQGVYGKTLYGKKCKINYKKKKKLKPIDKKKKNDGKLGRFMSMVESNYRGSPGEEKVANFLDSIKLSFIREVVFEKLLTRRFDFFIPSRNTLIEFDGKQHFQYIERYDRGDKTKLEARQQADREKDNFAKRHSLRLIRINYKEFYKIEEILASKLYK